MKRTPFVAISVATGASLLAGSLFLSCGSGNQRSVSEGDHHCSLDGDHSQLSCDENILDPVTANEKDVRAEVARFADEPPRGDGPWQFVVLDTGIGLKVRSTNRIEAEQLGGLQEQHYAWVDCYAVSDFDADPTTGRGPIWYRVRWGQQEPSLDFFESDPGAGTRAWAYAGYLQPWGHNGDIPECD